MYRCSVYVNHCQFICSKCVDANQINGLALRSDLELLDRTRTIESEFKENIIKWMATLRNGPLANKSLMVALITLSRKMTGYLNRILHSVNWLFLGPVELTHLSLASLLWDIGKQNSPRWDTAERGVPSGAILFA